MELRQMLETRLAFAEAGLKTVGFVLRALTVFELTPQWIAKKNGENDECIGLFKCETMMHWISMGSERKYGRI